MLIDVNGLLANAAEGVGGIRSDLELLGENLRELCDRTEAGDLSALDDFFAIYVFEGRGDYARPSAKLVDLLDANSRFHRAMALTHGELEEGRRRENEVADAYDDAANLAANHENMGPRPRCEGKPVHAERVETPHGASPEGSPSGPVALDRERFWSSSPDGLEWHDTESEARREAEAWVNHARDESGDLGWPDWTESIAWGEVRGRVVQTETKTRADYEAEGDEAMVLSLDTNGWDETADYELRDVAAAPLRPGDYAYTVAGRCVVLSDGSFGPPRTPEEIALLDERTALVGAGDVGPRVAEIDARVEEIRWRDPDAEVIREAADVLRRPKCPATSYGWTCDRPADHDGPRVHCGLADASTCARWVEGAETAPPPTPERRCPRCGAKFWCLGVDDPALCEWSPGAVKVPHGDE